MGLYINPVDGMSKRAWLQKFGERSTAAELLNDFDKLRAEGKVPVVLVDNGHFSVAAVGYDVRETQVFCDPKDSRPKLFFKVPVEEIKKILDPDFQVQVESYGL